MSQIFWGISSLLFFYGLIIMTTVHCHKRQQPVAPLCYVLLTSQASKAPSNTHLKHPSQAPLSNTFKHPLCFRAAGSFLKTDWQRNISGPDLAVFWFYFGKGPSDLRIGTRIHSSVIPAMRVSIQSVFFFLSSWTPLRRHPSRTANYRPNKRHLFQQ